jgi:hypothetical protein
MEELFEEQQGWTDEKWSVQPLRETAVSADRPYFSTSFNLTKMF